MMLHARDPEHRGPVLWGGFSTVGGADASVVGRCAQWVVLAACAGLVVEAALIQWGPGTWPQSDMPAISLGTILVALAVTVADIVIVAVHNWLVTKHRKRLRRPR